MIDADVVVNPEKVRRYHDGGMHFACLCCLMTARPAAGDTTLELPLPTGLSTDFASVVACIRDERNWVRVCEACADVIGSRDPVKIGQFGIDRIQASSWWSNHLEDHDKFALVTLVYLFTLAYARAYVRPDYPSFRSIDFANALSREAPTMPPLYGTTEGPLNEFVRDLGLGCYVSFTALGEDTVFLHDFASRRKHQGNGAIAFRKLVGIADRTNVTLMGVIEAHAKWGGRRDALSAAQLLRWYSRFGFTQIDEQQGRAVISRDPRTTVGSL